MAGTYGVDIVLLHKPQILKHPLTAYIMTRIWFSLMEIHALELDRLAVDKKLVADNLQTAEPDIHPCVFTVHIQKKGIQFRCLRTPLPCSRHDS